MYSVIRNNLSTLLLIVLTIFSLNLLLVPNVTFAADEAKANQCDSIIWTPGSCVHSMMANGIEAILTVFAYLVGLMGSLLGFVVDLTIVKMSLFMNPTANAPSSITVAWGLFRDIGNIFMIFALLVVGIAVILGIEGYGIKSLLPRIIIVAILINFSLFFCKAAIDFTNIFSLRFYDSIMTAAAVSNENVNGAVSPADRTNLGLGALVMDNLKLTSLYGVGRGGTTNTGQLGLAQANISTGSIVLVGFFGSILFIIVAAVFLAASLALISRFILLLFLTTLSSLALVALILPSTRKYWDQWLDSFLQNAFFAPLYMVLLWVSFQILTGLDIERILASGSGQGGGLGTFADLANSPATVGPLIVNFIIVCGFFIGSLMIAKQLGAYGAAGTLKGLNSMRKSAQSATIKYGGRFAGSVTAGSVAAIGRNTLGRYGDRLSRSDKFQAATTRKGVVGAIARTGMAITKGAASSTFDARNTGIVKTTTKSVGIDLGASKGGFKEREDAKQKKFNTRAEDYDGEKEAKDELLKLVAKLSSTIDGKSYVDAVNSNTKAEKELVNAIETKNRVLGDPSHTKEQEEEVLKKVQQATINKDVARVAMEQAEDKLTDSDKALARDIIEQEELVADGGYRGRYSKNIVGERWEFFNGMANYRRADAVKKISKGKSDEQKALEALRKEIKKEKENDSKGAGDKKGEGKKEGDD